MITKGNQNWSKWMTDSIIHKRPVLDGRWAYDYGVVSRGIERVWRVTGDSFYYDYIKRNMDNFVGEDGAISYYRFEDYNIDYVNNGKTLLMLYLESKVEKYKKAVDTLRLQLKTHPRTSDGGFWHKSIYPHQMWLDGLYMGGPFYAQYVKEFDDDHRFDDVARQFILMNRHAKDPKTGLIYHGWDESRDQRWADDITGCSPNFWGRAMGWYAMALVDVLDYLPETHRDRDEIIEIFRSMAASLALVQHRGNGLWYQVLDQYDREGNYPEASCSCMFTYAIAKAVRMGYIGKFYLDIAVRAMDGIIEHFVEEDEDGYLNLNDTVYCSGLGNTPYRDGSYDYYISEPKEQNNLLGIGAFIQACAELEVLELL